VIAHTSRTTRLWLAAAVFCATVLTVAAMPADAHARTSTVVSISTSSSYSRVYRSVTVRGRLTTKRGRALKGRTLRLESRTATGTVWTLVTKAKTGSTGRVARNVRPRKDTVYRYRYAGSSTYRPATSRSKKVFGHRYALRFWEPFDGTRVNTRTWSTEMQWGPLTTGLLQVYTPQAIDVDGGRLTITATRRTPDATSSRRYQSGVVSAHGPGQFDFTYGYVETRVKIPKGAGLWPAVWLLPKDGDIPAEIDVIEARGHEPRRNHMTLHYGDAQVKRVYDGPDMSAGYHTFGVDWARDHVAWYWDGVERYRVTDPAKIPDDPMYPLANLQLGGWGGTPTSATRFPARFYVDYIKVYQRE